MTWEENVLKELRDLKTINRQQLEVSGLQFALDPLRYIARKLRTGEAMPRVSSIYQLIAPAGVFTLTFANPPGYVWVGILQSIEVSQNGVFEFTAYVDDEIIPSLYIPRLVLHVINWSETIPFVHVVKERSTFTFINHDIADQWISADSMAIYLRKDVWERDIRLMDIVAEKYMYPAAPLMPPPLPR